MIGCFLKQVVDTIYMVPKTALPLLIISHAKWVVDNSVLASDQNGGERFKKRVINVVYQLGTMGPKPRFHYRPPHTRCVVDGLLLVGDRNDGGGFKNGVVDNGSAISGP